MTGTYRQDKFQDLLKALYFIDLFPSTVISELVVFAVLVYQNLSSLNLDAGFTVIRKALKLQIQTWSLRKINNR